jgi:hypothetical protein
MRKILMSAAAAATLLATPVFAQSATALSNDPEVRQQQEWELLVAKANADRHAPISRGDVAAVKSNTATDAGTVQAAPQSATALSNDPEVRQQQEWELLVAKANADRS